jgi:tight adherence protein B
MRLRHGLALCAAASALLLQAASPALAADATGRLSDITSSDGQLTAVFTAVDLPDGATLDPASVTLSVSGRQLAATAKPVEQAAKPVDRVAVMAIDVSRSMEGSRLAAAKAAATSFVSAVPKDVKVGLVTFSDTASLVVPPATDRTRLVSTIAALKVVNGTALLDGAVLAAQSTGTTGIRSVLLLSDGAEDGSSKRFATAQAAATAVTSTGAAFDAVAIGATPEQTQNLKALTDAGKGRLLSNTAIGDLTAVFQQSARAISNQLVVTAPVPADLQGTSTRVTVVATAGGQRVSDTAFVRLTAAGSPTTQATGDVNAAYGPAPVPTTRFAALGNGALYGALGAIFLALATILGVALVRVGGSERSGVRRRLSIYTLSGRQPIKQQETTTVLGDSQVARSAMELAGRVVKQRDLETVLGTRLEAAGLPLRAPEWLLIHVGSTLGLALLFLLLSGGGVAATVVGLVLGLVLPWGYLAFKESRRTSAFLAKMPDTLQLVAGGLSAGYSLPQALDSAVREGEPPISTEFNRALVEARLGVPIEDALEGVATRMKSRDFAWVVMAIRIQREVGGNLSEVLSTVAATLRERERLRRQVQVLSAEGRLSAWILGLLPVVFALYLVLVRPEYLRPLWTNPLGVVMVVVGVVLLTVGALWMRKAVTVEV